MSECKDEKTGRYDLWSINYAVYDAYRVAFDLYFNIVESGPHGSGMSHLFEDKKTRCIMNTVVTVSSETSAVDTVEQDRSNEIYIKQ